MVHMKEPVSEIKLEGLVCPSCNKLVNADKATGLMDPYSGIVLGYNLMCYHCDTVSFLNLLGKPPLFDLSNSYTATSLTNTI